MLQKCSINELPRNKPRAVPFRNRHGSEVFEEGPSSFSLKGIVREGLSFFGFDEKHTICYSEFQKERKS